MSAGRVICALLGLGLLACKQAPEGPPPDLRPDLRIEHVRMDLMATPMSLVAEIRNDGAGPAAGFDCRCFWSCPGRSLYSTELRIMQDANLAAGQKSSFGVAAPPSRFGCPGPPPVLDVSCMVDDALRIDETDEHNNAWTGPIRLTW